jgi:hypothetical protein
VYDTTLPSEILKANSTLNYDTALTFNRSIGSNNALHIYVSKALDTLKIHKQALMYWEGGDYSFEGEMGFRKFFASHDNYAIYEETMGVTIGSQYITGVTIDA